MSRLIDKKIYTDTVFVLLIIYGISTTLSIAATNVILGLLFILFLINFISKKKFFYSLEGLPLLYLFFWRAMRVSFNPSNWFKYGGKFWAHLPYFIISQFKVKKIKIIIYVTLAVASLTALLGIIQFFGGFNYPFLKLQIIRDDMFLGLNFRNRLHSGGYYSIITIISFVFFCYSNENKKTKIVLLIFSLLNFVAVLLTHTRTYYIAVLLTILLIVLLKKNWKWFIYGTVLVSILFFAPLKISHVLRNRVASIFDTKQNISNMMRLWMWKTALNVIKEQPIIGVGYRNWQYEVEKYFEKEKGQEPLLWIITRLRKSGVDEESILSTLKGHPHNAYLNVAVEEGLIGLTLFLLFWVGNSIAAFLRARLVKNENVLYTLNIAVGYSIIMLLFGAFFENNLTTARLLLPITFLMGLSYMKFEQEGKND